MGGVAKLKLAAEPAPVAAVRLTLVGPAECNDGVLEWSGEVTVETAAGSERFEATFDGASLLLIGGMRPDFDRCAEMLR